MDFRVTKTGRCSSVGRAVASFNRFRGMKDTKYKGIVSELQSITYFHQLGYSVSIPYGENSRYDFIVDVEGVLIKVQCKTAQLASDKNSISFRTHSTRNTTNTSTRRKYTSEEIDFFCTFFENQCYLVPVDECSLVKKLRFTIPKNGQEKGISFAKDYTVEAQLKSFRFKTL